MYLFPSQTIFILSYSQICFHPITLFLYPLPSSFNHSSTPSALSLAPLVHLFTITMTQTTMGARFNYPLPNEYFLDPRYDTSYVQSTMRHDSGHSTSSSYSSDVPYSPYSSSSYTQVQSPYTQPQSSGNALHLNQLNSYYSPPSSSYLPQLSNPQYRVTSSSRHKSTSSSYTSPHTPPSTNSSPVSSSARERHYCSHSSCVDRHGQRSSFSRRADMLRHEQSVHGSQLHDCPFRRCERKGERGFPRLDHLIEHRRGFHHEAIPKREASR
jgi:hypothetical protein